MVTTKSESEIVYVGKGITSKQEVSVKISLKETGHGIIFRIPDKKNEGQHIDVPAKASSVVNTLRNVTLGVGPSRLILVEHILCAVALWGLEDLLIEVSGPEIPLGDGSAMFWLDLLESSGWQRREIAADLELKEPVVVKKGDRMLMAIPDDQFSVNYFMDYNHPMIGKCWQSWTSTQNPREIGDARTFGSEKEHMMLGIGDEVVSMTTDGFSKELRWTDEPVRHKLLDLVGDLVLSGVNPLRWKARFISIKGGHEMDVEFAKKLEPLHSN